ncbi:hypothetical protein GOP47_0002188 [Adiantum capillus-veneris]|uniref:Heterokaryon incompatibility domain-containing protein n=1 Tax=Adiantum capillus-veneris TaxID=13818 RepID=A0A9D4VAG5_ADICA|nr:hypothetical protein GOP47_0002188 [Adiantum capillus-veneris]
MSTLTINPQEPNMKALLSSLHSAHIQHVTDLISYLHAAALGNPLRFRQRAELVTLAQMLNDAADGKPLDTSNPPTPHLLCGHEIEQVVSIQMLKSSLDLLPDQSEDPLADFVAQLFSRLRSDYADAWFLHDEEQDKDLSFHAWALRLVEVIDMIVAGKPISVTEHKQLLTGLIKTMDDLLTDINHNSLLNRSSDKDHSNVAEEGYPEEHEDVLRQLAVAFFDRLSQGHLTLESEHQRVLAALMTKSSQQRADFVKNLDLQPPTFLRLIDCKASVQQGKVILVDWSEEVGYTAVSHTYGMAVYEVFNCPCASEYRGTFRPRCNPALNCSTIGGQQVGESLDVKSELCTTHKNAMGDILRMCEILLQNRMLTNYVWHDGVCIAQFDASEVEETIKHMGWIYANAFETIIFLHYIGSPMAPIRLDGDLVARWHTRVWTLQEAVLSQNLRYCVRLGHNLVGDDGIRKRGQTFAEFKANLATWYEEETSTVCVLEENRFLALLVILMQSMPKSCLDSRAGSGEGQSEETTLAMSGLEELVEQDGFLSVLLGPSPPPDLPERASEWLETSPLGGLLKDAGLLKVWRAGVHNLYEDVVTRAIQMPDLESTLEICNNRDSKHEGDRINSILALAEVKGFTVDKDEHLEKNTIEFLKRQGKKGLASAIFLTNIRVMVEKYDDDTGEEVDTNERTERVIWAYTRKREHTWVPNLSLRLQAPEIAVMGRQLLDFLLDGLFTKDHRQQLEKVSFEVIEDDNLQLSGPWSMVVVGLRFVKENEDGRATQADSGKNDTTHGNQQHEQCVEEGILPLEVFPEAGNTDALIVRDPVSLDTLGRAAFPLDISVSLERLVAFPLDICEGVFRGTGGPLMPDWEDRYFYVLMDDPILAFVAFPSNDNPRPSMRALLLEYGDLAHPVAKLASLVVNRAFQDLLQTSNIPITLVDTFVIC